MGIILYCCVCFLFLQVTLQDSQVELETYKQTRQGLDEMYNVVWKQYKEETRIRQVAQIYFLLFFYSIWLYWHTSNQ